jgi:Xaa-Pro dipeptidase
VGVKPSTPPAEIEARVTKFQRLLAESGLDAALIVQNADLFYLAGTVQQSFLYVPADGEPTLFVRRVLERARRESALAQVVPLASRRDLPAAIVQRYGRLPRRCGLELDVLPVLQLRGLESLFPGTTFEDVGAATVRLRAVKSPYEIERIRAAAELFDELCARVPALVREGMPETEFAGLVEAEARKLGHEGVIRMRRFNQEMFYGHLLSGPSLEVATFLDTPMGGEGLSAAVAQGVSRRRIARGDPIMLDFVFVTGGYMADSTRMLCLGPLPQPAQRAYETALAVEAAVCAAAGPGVVAGDLYRLALDLAAGEGYEESFMGAGGTRVRFIGHGVGLELDELPVLALRSGPLEQGMVFALEPKVILPGIGAVGIENTYAVTAGGVERLQRSPEDVIEV